MLWNFNFWRIYLGINEEVTSNVLVKSYWNIDIKKSWCVVKKFEITFERLFIIYKSDRSCIVSFKYIIWPLLNFRFPISKWSIGKSTTKEVLIEAWPKISGLWPSTVDWERRYSMTFCFRPITFCFMLVFCWIWNYKDLLIRNGKNHSCSQDI